MSNLSLFERIGSLVPAINYSALTLDDLEHPRLVAIYSIYWEVSLIMTTIFFAFMLYVIITKSSKEMSGYKWYLVHQLTWSYVFDVYLGLWKPVPFWPFYLAYSAGVFSDISEKYIPLQILLLVVNSIGMGFAIYISAMHRYMQASPFSFLYKLYNLPLHRTIAYVFFFVLLIGVVCVPLIKLIPEHSVLKESMSSRLPVLKHLFDVHPSILGYDPSLNNNASVAYLLILILVLLLVALSIVGLYFNFLRILRKNKQHLSSGTYKMQLMLFRTLFIQIALAGVLLILPITTCLILMLFGVTWVSAFSLFAIAVIGTHAFVDFIVLTYFIKSYREYVKGLFNKLRAKLGFKVTVPSVQLANATSTGIPSHIR